jgi:hypothetical protein
VCRQDSSLGLWQIPCQFLDFCYGRHRSKSSFNGLEGKDSSENRNIGRIRGRLGLKELGQLAGGIHHNAVGIAIRRFTQRLQSDRTLLEKVSLVQRELEPR